MSRDFARYARQIVLPEIGVNGQTLLEDSTALVIGVGGLGSVASLYLAGAGVGRLLLSDRDRVDLSNLQRQIVYRQTDVGHDKSQSASRQLQSLNPQIKVELRPGPLDPAALLAAVSEADIVLDCSDNFPTRFALNRACIVARKPLVSGAAIRFEGQIALFDSARGSACYRCLYPETGEVQERCEDAGVFGPVVGVIGSMQALVVLKYLLGLSDDAGRLYLWDALRLQWRSVSVPRDPQCPACDSHL